MSKVTKPAVAVADEQKTAENVANLNEQQKAPAAPPTVDELRSAYKSAAQHAFDIAMDDTKTDDEKMAATMASYKAQKAVNDRLASEKAEKLKAEQTAKLAEARAHVCQLLGIDDAKLTAIIADDVARTSVQTVFGNKPVQAKPEQTGKSLVRESGGTSKTDEVYGLFDAGNTYDAIIAAGYADGTIRSAAWKGQYKKNADGTYTKK